MLIDNINLNQLRIFECVYRTGSMTLAARELHMTQPGISQHIHSLEEMLETRLFDRMKQRLVPTAAGTALFRQCSKTVNEIEQILLEIQGGQKELRGTVAIGMPIEFGNNVVMPILARFIDRNPRVRFRFKLDFASVMNDLLLRGEIDFAFVDQFAMNKRITTEKVYDEVLELCVAKSLLQEDEPESLNAEWFQKLPYIEYQDDAPLLRMWFSHHLGPEAADLKLDIRATIMDVQGISRLIQARMGAGILPGHLLSQLQKGKEKLYRFEGCGEPLKNTISLAWMKDRTFSPAALAAMEWLRSALKIPA